MKIRRITATPINLRLEAPYAWVFGELDGFSPTIVEVETEDGLIGLGEAPTPAAAAIINDVLAARLVGRDAFDIAGAEAVCLPYWTGVQSINDRTRIMAFGAIEMALWDLRGKAWKQPLYQLLGGAVRKDIPFTDYFSLRGDGPKVKGETTPEAVADYCVELHETYGDDLLRRQVLDAGSEDLAQNGGTHPPETRRRCDDPHRFQPGLFAQHRRRLARPLEDLGVRNWEDPVATIEEMRELRRHCSIPFSTHNIDIARAMEIKVPDAFVGNPTVHGGIGRMLRFVGACEHAGIDFWCYSGDSGIGSAAYLHLCAALGWIREPNQSLFRMLPMDVTEEGPFSPRNNVVRVPEGHGLGVTLSRENLAACHRDFVENGPCNKYHDPVKPGTYRRLPLD